jgi:hypothetical protein
MTRAIVVGAGIGGPLSRGRLLRRWPLDGMGAGSTPVSGINPGHRNQLLPGPQIRDTILALTSPIAWRRRFEGMLPRAS